MQTGVVTEWPMLKRQVRGTLWGHGPKTMQQSSQQLPAPTTIRTMTPGRTTSVTGQGDHQFVVSSTAHKAMATR